VVPRHRPCRDVSAIPGPVPRRVWRLPRRRPRAVPPPRLARPRRRPGPPPAGDHPRRLETRLAWLLPRATAHHAAAQTRPAKQASNLKSGEKYPRQGFAIPATAISYLVTKTTSPTTFVAADAERSAADASDDFRRHRARAKGEASVRLMARVQRIERQLNEKLAAERCPLCLGRNVWRLRINGQRQLDERDPVYDDTWHCRRCRDPAPEIDIVTESGRATGFADGVAGFPELFHL
jgi:hypothetical protein